MDEKPPEGRETGIHDEDMRRALGLLVEAITMEIRPGGFELKLAASTLRDLLEDPSPQSYSLAVRTFDSLDRETRSRIRAHAEDAATGRGPVSTEVVSTEVVSKEGVSAQPAPARTKARSQTTPPTTARAKSPVKSLASGLLGMLNFGAGRASPKAEAIRK